jgi:ElaB/YqjD/DUF883 family membrane-anchored ribosome-binding protein
MADEEDQLAESVFEVLVSITNKSGNLRKDLKQDIIESVSTLRKVLAKMKTVINDKSKENKKLSEEVRKATEETERARDRQPERHETPSW